MINIEVLFECGEVEVSILKLGNRSNLLHVEFVFELNVPGI
jgi:hypothetical protein